MLFEYANSGFALRGPDAARGETTSLIGEMVCMVLDNPSYPDFEGFSDYLYSLFYCYEFSEQEARSILNSKFAKECDSDFSFQTYPGYDSKQLSLAGFDQVITQDSDNNKLIIEHLNVLLLDYLHDLVIRFFEQVRNTVISTLHHMEIGNQPFYFQDRFNQVLPALEGYWVFIGKHCGHFLFCFCIEQESTTIKPSEEDRYVNLENLVYYTALSNS